MTAEEAKAVEAMVASDPNLAADLEDFRLIGALFGHVEPEQVSKALEKRLYALDALAPVKGYTVVRQAPAPPRTSWATRVAAIAAVALLAVGVVQLTSRPEIVLSELTRFTVGPDGTLTHVEPLRNVTAKAGQTFRAGERERLSIRTREGDRMTVLPGGALSIGDPLDGEIFELERGTALCSVLKHDAPRTVVAGPYRIYVTREAHFGVQISDSNVRPAGVSLGTAEVTVTVSLGAVEILKDGDGRETLGAYQRAVFTPRGETRTHAAADPALYRELMRSYREYSREIIPGYFTGEPGVAPIAQKWNLKDGTRVLVLSDEGVGAIDASYLVLWVRASEPGPLRLTRIRPLIDRPGEAETATLETAPVGTDWTVVALKRADFDGPTAERGTRVVGENQSRFVRLQLAGASPRVQFEVQASLWAARPPVELSEVAK